MNKLQTIVQALRLNTSSLQAVAQDEKFTVSANLANLFIGLVYGTISIMYNWSFIASFETDLLRNLFIPLFFLTSGIIMMYLTRVGFTLLLWAGGRAFGGPGLLGVLNRVSGIILLPSIIAIPGFVSLTVNGAASAIEAIGIILALIWIYLLASRSLMLSQKLAAWKAYIAVLAVFIFFSSVYYMVLPPAS